MPASIQKIIISRTDNIGDVILTLPVAGFLREKFPQATIGFLGKSYTRPVITASRFVDEFIDRDQVLNSPGLLKDFGADAIIFIYPDREVAKLAKQVGIALRIGTSHRLFHWQYCNKLVNLSRKSSERHEAQLNFSLLKPLGLHYLPALSEIPQWYGMDQWQGSLPAPIAASVQTSKFKLVLHPKSKGSAREWPLSNYLQLAQLLTPNQFEIFVTGTQAEGELIRQQNADLLALPHVTDVTGQLSLTELISLIAQADGLVACSTGPLHIAAALGKFTLGIYPPLRPMHPGRWAPIGTQAHFLCLLKDCTDCRKTQNCSCIRSIEVQQVLDQLIQFYEHSQHNFSTGM